MRHPHDPIYSIRCHRTKFSAIEMKVSFRSAALDKHTVFLPKSLCYRNVSGMKGLPLWLIKFVVGFSLSNFKWFQVAEISLDLCVSIPCEKFSVKVYIFQVRPEMFNHAFVSLATRLLDLSKRWSYKIVVPPMIVGGGWNLLVIAFTVSTLYDVVWTISGDCRADHDRYQ